MYIKIIAHPGAKKATIKKIADDTFDVAVREPAERNEANRAIVAAISDYLNIPSGKIRVISGHHHPKKILSIDI